MMQLMLDADDLAFIRDCISDRVNNLIDLQDELGIDFVADIEQGERLLGLL